MAHEPLANGARDAGPAHGQEPNADIRSGEAGGEDEAGTVPPPPPPAPDVPVPVAERIRSLDLLRGVAVLGILLINVWTFALPFPAAMNPNLEGFDQGADRVAYAFVHLFGYTKMMPIFSMLFGAGILLFTGRVEGRGGHSGRRWFARQWWLLVIGLLHGYLLWNGDILVPYAVVGLILYRFRRLRPRTLVILAVIAMMLPKLAMYGGSIFMEHVRDTAVEAEVLQAAGEELTREQERFLEVWTETGADWTPDAERFAETVALMRGVYGGILRANASELFIMHVFMYPLVFNWSIAGFMMIGMVLFKTGVLQGQRSDRFYVRMAVVGYGLGLPGAWLGMRFMEANFADFILMLRYSFATTEVSGPLVSLGHIALVVLAGRHGWFGALEARLVAAGRMAFTNYLAQTVIGVTLFYGYGFGLYARLSRVEMLGVVVGIWVLQLLWSPWWLARFRFGPAEWLWRTLTYGRGQSFSREVVAEISSSSPTETAKTMGRQQTSQSSTYDCSGTEQSISDSKTRPQ